MHLDLYSQIILNFTLDFDRFIYKIKDSILNKINEQISIYGGNINGINSYRELMEYKVFIYCEVPSFSVGQFLEKMNYGIEIIVENNNIYCEKIYNYLKKFLLIKGGRIVTPYCRHADGSRPPQGELYNKDLFVKNIEIESEIILNPLYINL